MTYFTSWDANVFLCLLYLGIPEDVVKIAVKIAKKTHEEFSLEEAKNYWMTNSPRLVPIRRERMGKTLKFQINETLNFTQTRLNVWARHRKMKREFKDKWRWRCPEIRRHFVVRWTRSEWDWNCKHVWEKEPYTDRGEGKSRAGYWNSGEAWWYSIKGWDDVYESSDNDSDKELTLEYEHDNTWERHRRLYVSQWYENIHEGRYFLFFKENDLSSDWDKYRNNQNPYVKCITDLGERWQVAQDLLTIDGPGLGESPKSKIEHIDDLFLD